MMRHLIVIYVTIALFSCCIKQDFSGMPELQTDKNGVVLKQPYIWKVSLTDGSYIGTFVDPSIIWQNKILFGAETNNSSELALVDIDTGEKLWQIPFISRDLVALDCGYQSSNLTLIDGASSTLFALSMETGEIAWTYPRESGFWSTYSTGIDSFFLMCGPSKKNPKPYKIDAVWYGDMATGKATELYYPDLGPKADTCYNVVHYNNAGGVRQVVPFKNSLAEILMVIYYRSYIIGPRGEDYFSLYNFTKREFVYRDIKLSSGNYSFIHLINDKIYFTLWEGVFCYDLYTGEKLWNNSVHIPYGKVIAENKLYGIDHGIDSYLVGVDLETGKQLWRVLSKQCIAPMRYLNGIIYFVSSEDEKLHAYEAQTGKKLWQVESPDFGRDHGAFFKPECSVVPGKDGHKGKVIVSSYLNGFCYEAIR